jgi:hypothetical protein
MSWCSTGADSHERTVARARRASRGNGGRDRRSGPARLGPSGWLAAVGERAAELRVTKVMRHRHPRERRALACCTSHPWPRPRLGPLRARTPPMRGLSAMRMRGLEPPQSLFDTDLNRIRAASLGPQAFDLSNPRAPRTSWTRPSAADVVTGMKRSTRPRLKTDACQRVACTRNGRPAARPSSRARNTALGLRGQRA